VDLEHLVIRVTHQMDSDRRVAFLKTDASYREIWIPAVLADRLAELRAGSPWARPEDYVFATRTGGPKSAGNVRKSILYPAVRRAGLDAARRHEDRVVFHSLRHTYVSMLISNRDISEATIARLVGHSSTITLRLTYEHLFNQHRDESEVRRHSGAVLDEVLGPDPGPEPDRGHASGTRAKAGRDDDHDGQATAVRRTLMMPRR
jgi:integrase